MANAVGKPRLGSQIYRSMLNLKQVRVKTPTIIQMEAIEYSAASLAILPYGKPNLWTRSKTNYCLQYEASAGKRKPKLYCVAITVGSSCPVYSVAFSPDDRQRVHSKLKEEAYATTTLESTH